MSADPQSLPSSPERLPRRMGRPRSSVANLKSPDSSEMSPARLRLALPRESLARALSSLLQSQNMAELRRQIGALRVQALQWNRQSSSPNPVWFKGTTWQNYLQQIEESKTLKRAHYYVERLRRGVEHTKTSGCNDVNLYRWQEYEDILTDSLWLMDKRDRSGVHNAGYWGNFVPQIPQQLLSRYTKAGEWVLDPFMGSGTTLIECQRLGRHGLGIDLQSVMTERARELVEAEDNPAQVKLRFQVGDSRTIDYSELLAREGVAGVQFVMLHPPYHDIIRFSQDERCLSNSASVDDFLHGFGEVTQNALKVLDKGRYLAIVIGDKYSDSEWVPLGFRCMQVVESLGCTLKSIVVKNFEATAGKRQTTELWRYRALAGGFYVFKHEYIFIMQKG